MKDREREVRKALDDEKEYKKVLDGCSWCFDGKYLEKNLVVSIGKNVKALVLSLPKKLLVCFE
jgi:hypothetical protein